MKPLIAASMIAAAAASSSGCAPAEMSVFVEGAATLDNTCVPNTDVELIRGSLDLGAAAAAGVAPRYFGHFGLRSDLESTTIKSGEDTLAGDTRNEFVADHVRISYTLQGGATVPEALEPIYFVVPPGSTDSSIQFQMLSKDAAQVIAGAVPNGADDTLTITFNFEGNVRAGTNSPLKLSTTKVAFPVRLVNRTPPTLTCAAPAVQTVVGPCGNAQESFTYACQ